jgi:hypothetical protein
LVAYVIENISGGALNGLYAGHYVDFDVDGGNLNDSTAYDGARAMGYQWDTTYVGSRYLTDGVSSYQNDAGGAVNTDATRYAALSAAGFDGTRGPGDVEFVMGVGPFNLADGEVTVLGTAWVAGSGLADLQTNADAAMDMWLQSGGCGTCPVIQGTVSYAGSATGGVYVRAFSDLGQDPDFSTVIAEPGVYQLPICTPGEYSVCGFMDAAGNGEPPDEGVDPERCYPVVVEANWGEDIVGIDITLEDPVFVPEPGSVLLVASGLMGLAGYAGLRKWKR